MDQIPSLALSPAQAAEKAAAEQEQRVLLAALAAVALAQELSELAVLAILQAHLRRKEIMAVTELMAERQEILVQVVVVAHLLLVQLQLETAVTVGQAQPHLFLALL